MYSISQFLIKPYLVGAEDYPHFLHIMAILFVLNVLIMLVIGKYYPRKTAFQLEYTKQVDIVPWKYIKIVSIAIVSIVTGIYIYFS